MLFFKTSGIINKSLVNISETENEAWLSLVERCVRDAEVAGSNPVASIYWPVGQAVKTTASHAVNPGSIPGRVIESS